MERGFFVALHALRPVVAGATGSPLTQMISGKHHNAVFIGVALLVWCMGVVVDASATEYDAVADLYNVDYFKLENGCDKRSERRGPVVGSAASTPGGSRSERVRRRIRGDGQRAR